MLLLLKGYKNIWFHIRQSQNDFASDYSRALFAALSGFLSWFLLGHAAVSQPRGAMLLFFVFGLVVVQSNLVKDEAENVENHLVESVL